MVTPPLSTQPATAQQRVIRRRNGVKTRATVRRVGLQHSRWSDVYYFLLSAPWPVFFGIVSVTYLAVNVLFAFAYMAEANGIANAHPGVFLDDFSFSIQTFATIGYGVMYPRTLYTNLVMTFEVLVGLLVIAVATGLAFARFARPTARVIFSDVAVVHPVRGLPTLSFRAANQRDNQILEAQVCVSLVRDEFGPDGEYLRRFYDLTLLRSKTPVFALTWTIMHPIDERSPLYGETADSLGERNVEVIVTLTGLDETVSQTIHARHSYLASEIRWGVRLADIITRLPGGERLIDYNYFHRTVPLVSVPEVHHRPRSIEQG